MSDDELVEANERLANPPMVDFALSRMLGLYVVARLAQRYNIKVQLRHSWYGGITALVLLPPTVAVRAPMPEAIEAPSRRGPAELVASAKPAEPAVEEEEGGEHLPIFEAARSDWFEDGVRGDHLPLRRHAAQQPHGRAAEPTGNGAGTLTGAGAARLPDPDGARTDAERAEELRAEAIRAETARMEAAAQAEAAKAETAEAEAEEARPEAAWPGAPTASAAPQAEAGAAPRGDAPGPGPGRCRPGLLGRRARRRAAPSRSRRRRPPERSRGRRPLPRRRRAGRAAVPIAPGRPGAADRVRAGRAPAAQPVPASPEPVPAPAERRADVAAAAPTSRRPRSRRPRPASPQGPAGQPRPRDGRRAGGGDRGQDRAGRRRPARLPRGQDPGGGPEHAVELPVGPRARPDGSRRRCRKGDNPHSSSRSDHDDATQ